MNPVRGEINAGQGGGGSCSLRAVFFFAGPCAAILGGATEGATASPCPRESPDLSSPSKASRS